MAYTNLYSFAGQFAMSKKQKQGLVAKTLARTKKKKPRILFSGYFQ